MVYYDVRQAFDSLWTSKSYLDLYTNGVDDDMLNLLHESSKEVEISVKTPVGITEKTRIHDIILQGETISSTVCTSSIDVIDKECDLEKFKYRKVIDIPKLSFVDDIADIAKCGKDTEEMNKYTVSEISKRKLQLAVDKTHRMHVGSKRDCYDVSLDEWTMVKEKVEGRTTLKDSYTGKAVIESVMTQEYLGTFVTSDGSNAKTIENKVARGQGIINDIMSILNLIPIKAKYFETALLLRSSLLLSVLLHDVEILHNITKREIKSLEKVDNQLVSRILETSTKVSVTLKMLELGIIPIPYLYYIFTS